MSASARPGAAPAPVSPAGLPGTAPAVTSPSGLPRLGWPQTGPIGLRGPRPATSPGGLPLLGPWTGGLTLTRGGARPTVSGFDPVVRGRGLARLSRRPRPTTASELQRATVRWVVMLWAMLILLQRFQLPGQEIALLLPLSLAWCGYGLVRGVLTVEQHRFLWWLAAAGVSALIVPVQYALVPDPVVSLTSWGLLLVTWLVFVVRLVDRRRETYRAALAGMLRVSLWQAALVVAFLAVQVVLPYDPASRDWVAKTFPRTVLLQNYTLSYPFAYGSSWYRSNGWIGLETSFTSMQLALGVIAALLLRRALHVVLFLLVAIACTGAQSGVQMLAVAVLVLLFSKMRWALARYSVMVPAVAAFLVSPLGANTITRLTEGTGTNTSTGQRSTVPYQLLWPEWIKEPSWVLFGRGPGSSQQIVDSFHIIGVIVPSPVKLFFDYGVVAGLALAAFLAFMYLGSPSRAMALAMASAYWLFQPGTTQILLILTVVLFVTWWTPRRARPLEDDVVPSPHAAVVPARR